MNSAESSTLPTTTPLSEVMTGTLNEDVNNTEMFEISTIRSHVQLSTTARNRSTKNNTGWARRRHSRCPAEHSSDCPRFVDNYSSFYLKVSTK